MKLLLVKAGGYAAVNNESWIKVAFCLGCVSGDLFDWFAGSTQAYSRHGFTRIFE